MGTPGRRTLLSFLSQGRRSAPATFTRLFEEGGRGYGMVNRYIRFCLSRGLIRVVSERRTRERYPSKTYDLSGRGARLLRIFGGRSEQAGQAAEVHPQTVQRACYWTRHLNVGLP